jgi:hypothetical protein
MYENLRDAHTCIYNQTATYQNSTQHPLRDRQPEDAVGSAPNCRFYEKIRIAAQTLSNVGQSCGTPPSPHAAIDREFRLDTILLALWHGRLTAEAAAERIIAELGLGRQAARDEVDGFLRD